MSIACQDCEEIQGRKACQGSKVTLRVAACHLLLEAHEQSACQ